MSTLPTVVYRTDTFPGLGFLLKKSFFDSSMNYHMDECCMNRSVIIGLVSIAFVVVAFVIIVVVIIAFVVVVVADRQIAHKSHFM